MTLTYYECLGWFWAEPFLFHVPIRSKFRFLIPVLLPSLETRRVWAPRIYDAHQGAAVVIGVHKHNEKDNSIKELRKKYDEKEDSTDINYLVSHRIIN